MNTLDDNRGTLQVANSGGIDSGTNFLAGMGVHEFRHSDILAWWKGMEDQFPILSAIVWDLLTVQASMITSQSVFFMLVLGLYHYE